MEGETDPPASKLEDLAATYREHGEALRVAVAEALPLWLDGQLSSRLGRGLEPAEKRMIDDAARRADESLTELITAGVEQPLSGPLERLRVAVAPAGAILADAGVARPSRDPFDVRSRPDDHYALGPLTFMDLGQKVHEAGITWGAAKAFLHRAGRN